MRAIDLYKSFLFYIILYLITINKYLSNSLFILQTKR